jgi:hypothetical protein
LRSKSPTEGYQRTFKRKFSRTFRSNAIVLFPYVKGHGREAPTRRYGMTMISPFLMELEIRKKSTSNEGVSEIIGDKSQLAGQRLEPADKEE